MKVISVKRVFLASGGPAGLRDMLIRAGQPTPIDAASIGNWSSRGRLPGRWAGAVLFALHDQAQVDPLDLIDEAPITAKELGL